MSISVSKHGKRYNNFSFEDKVFKCNSDGITINCMEEHVTINATCRCMIYSLNNSIINVQSYNSIVCSFDNIITTGIESVVHCGVDCDVTVGEQSTVTAYSGTTITATGNNVIAIRLGEQFQVVTLNKGQTIQFNDDGEYGYTVIEKLPEVKITIDGKEVTLSEDSIKSIMSALK